MFDTTPFCIGFLAVGDQDTRLGPTINVAFLCGFLLQSA